MNLLTKSTQRETSFLSQNTITIKEHKQNMANNKAIGVSIVLALVFVATTINVTVNDKASSRRKLTVESTHEKVFMNEDEIMNQLVIKPYEVLGHLPCVPEDSPENQGIFYIKVPKTSSSTLAGPQMPKLKI